MCDVLERWAEFELDDSVYAMGADTPGLGDRVEVLPFDRTRGRLVGGMHYLLGFEQIRDVIEGLTESTRTNADTRRAAEGGPPLRSKRRLH